jgi:hypothetical protein
MEVVEHGKIGEAVARAQPIGFGLSASSDRTSFRP